jgi:hypothetical protein
MQLVIKHDYPNPVAFSVKCVTNIKIKLQRVNSILMVSAVARAFNSLREGGILADDKPLACCPACCSSQVAVVDVALFLFET